MLATIQLPKEDEDHRLGLDDIRQGLTGLDAKQIARIKAVVLRVESSQTSDLTINVSKGDNDSVQIELDGADAASVAELRRQLDRSGGLDQGTFQQVGDTVTKAVAGLLGPHRSRSASSNLSISIRLSRVAPGIQAEVVGDDDLVVRGARESLVDALRAKRPRVGAPPFAVTYLVAYFITFMYGVAIGQFGLLDWVPDIVVIGPIIYFVCLILPSAALGYLVFWMMNSVLLPPLELAPKGRSGVTSGDVASYGDRCLGQHHCAGPG